jgi:NAD+ kinase
MKKDIKKICVVYKRSVYQKYVLDEGHQRMQDLIHQKHVSAKTLIHSHDRHTSALESILKTLGKSGISYDVETRHNLQKITGYDLILTVGGDGTFLSTAHQIKNQLIMGINSAPTVSVGALCTIKFDQFEKKLHEILTGKYKVKELSRIRIDLNGSPLPFEAVNDILFTNISPAATSRYIIKLGRQSEEHKSSGVWVSTAVGSTAAISAAGGKPMKKTDKRLQFRSREPYQGIYNKYDLTYGFIKPNQSLTIIDKMVESRIYIDGPRDLFNLHYGDELKFSLSKNTLKVIA